MKEYLIPSMHFYVVVNGAKDTLTFKRSKIIGIIFWFLLPMVVCSLIGYYIADILFD